MKKDSCLQIILETSPFFPGRSKEFAAMLSSYAEDLFNDRVRSILNSVDAQSRATIIVSLPATEKRLSQRDKGCIGGCNPAVRIASIWGSCRVQ